MAIVVLGIKPIPIPDELLLDYTLSSKKVVIDSIPESKGWITNGVYIDDPVERSKMVKTLKLLYHKLNQKILLKNAVFCITKFTDRNNWEAVRVKPIKKDSNIYAPLVDGLLGSAKLVMSEGHVLLSYFSKTVITEELIG